MASIEAVGAREILDSRGNPTVEVEVALDGGSGGSAAVPSGALTGAARRSSCVMAASGTAARAWGRPSPTVLDVIGPRLRGMDACEQPRSTGRWATSTAPRTRAGSRANSMLGVSLAVARAAADSAGLPLYRYVGGPNAHLLPVPMMNIVNGGAHADTGVDVQEFMIAPIGAATFAEALRQGAEVYRAEVGA